MSQGTPLTGKKSAAAILVADDEKSDEAIAKDVGVSRRQLARWKLEPEFQDAVQRHIEESSRRLQRYHIARKDKRVAEYDTRWRAIIQVRRERAADKSLSHIPGASTGLIVRRLKVIGAGDKAQVVEEYEVDTGTLSEQLKLEKQGSQESGQWTEKSELTGDIVTRSYIGVPVEDV